MSHSHSYKHSNRDNEELDLCFIMSSTLPCARETGKVWNVLFLSPAFIILVEVLSGLVVSKFGI